MSTALKIVVLAWLVAATGPIGWAVLVLFLARAAWAESRKPAQKEAGGSVFLKPGEDVDYDNVARKIIEILLAHGPGATELARVKIARLLRWEVEGH